MWRNAKQNPKLFSFTKFGERVAQNEDKWGGGHPLQAQACFPGSGTVCWAGSIPVPVFFHFTQGLVLAWAPPLSLSLSKK